MWPKSQVFLLVKLSSTWENILNIGEIFLTIYPSFSSAIISSEGKVFTFGATSFGRLGTDRDGSSGNNNSTKRSQNTPLEVRYFRNLPIHSLASGDFHMLALAHDCSVYSWGCGSDGQLVSALLYKTDSPLTLLYS